MSEETPVSTPVTEMFGTDPATAALVEKVQAAARELAAAHGPFAAFALLEPADTPGRWDVVASAPWLDTGREGISLIAHAILRHLTPGEAVQLARIVPLHPRVPFVWFLQQRYQQRPGPPGRPALVANEIVNGTEILRGFVLPPEGVAPDRPVEAAA